MNKVGQCIRTTTATISLIAPRFVEQRYLVDARFTNGVVEQNRKARLKLTGGAPCVLLVIVPAEFPVHPPAANEDHFRKDSEARSIIALAVVANSPEVSAATKFYFRYYPQAFEARVFDEEEDAGTWLKEVLTRTQRTD